MTGASNWKPNIARLIATLRSTAAGECELFGHNGERWSRTAIAPTRDHLAETGGIIEKIRAQLATSPFALQQVFSRRVGGCRRRRRVSRSSRRLGWTG